MEVTCESAEDAGGVILQVGPQHDLRRVLVNGTGNDSLVTMNFASGEEMNEWTFKLRAAGQEVPAGVTCTMQAYYDKPNSKIKYRGIEAIQE